MNNNYRFDVLSKSTNQYTISYRISTIQFTVYIYPSPKYAHDRNSVISIPLFIFDFYIIKQMSTIIPIIRKIYINDWIRIPIKFIFTFFAIKIGYDYSEYVTAYRIRRPNIRTCLYDNQSPAAPFLPLPYPFYTTYEEYQYIKRANRVQNDMQKSWMEFHDKQFVLVDLPCRENVNLVDHLMIRAKSFSCSESIKFFLINEIAQKQGSLPQGIFKQVRNIQADSLNINAPLIPKL